MASTLIEKDIYNGQYHIVHNPAAKGRAPRYKVDDQTPPGVTSILSKVLAKDFVGWALDCMETELLDSKSMDIKGVEYFVHTPETIKEAKGASARKRDQGGNTGTEVHAMVEQYLKGEDVVMGKRSPDVQNAFVAFVKWFDQSGAKVLSVEEVVYSQLYGYAGTHDCILEIDGKVYLCDLKTTNSSKVAPNGVYAEYFVQLGAYAFAHEEQRIYEDPDTELTPIDGLMVISAKKDGKLDIVTNEDVGLTVANCTSLWLSVFELYSGLNKVTERLGGRR